MRTLDLSKRCEHVGKAEPGTDEWHAIRAQGLGGSDAAQVLDISKFGNPLKLWEEKTGRRDGVPSTPPMRLGNILEPFILERERAFDGSALGTFRSKKRPYMLANIDGWRWLDEEQGVAQGIEIKCTGVMKDWDGGPPPFYRTQVQHYMYVTGIPTFEFVVVEVPSGPVRESLVLALEAMSDRPEERDAFLKEFANQLPITRFVEERDLELMKQICDAEEAFWRAVNEDEEPAGRPQEIELGSAEAAALYKQWADNKAMRSECERKRKEAQRSLITMMAGCEFGNVSMAGKRIRLCRMDSGARYIREV